MYTFKGTKVRAELFFAACAAIASDVASSKGESPIELEWSDQGRSVPSRLSGICLVTYTPSRGTREQYTELWFASNRLLLVTLNAWRGDVGGPNDITHEETRPRDSFRFVSPEVALSELGDTDEKVFGLLWRAAIGCGKKAQDALSLAVESTSDEKVAI